MVQSRNFLLLLNYFRRTKLNRFRGHVVIIMSKTHILQLFEMIFLYLFYKGAQSAGKLFKFLILVVN